MRLDEQAVRADRQRRAREHRRKFALARRLVAAAAGQLHGMRRVKNNRKAERLHDRNRAHVGDEIVVAERRAAFGQENLFCAGHFCFFRDAPHFVRRKELAFFQVHDFSGRDGGFNQIRLAAKKRGDLQNVHDLARARGLLFRVHVRQNWHAEFLADVGKRFQSAFDARPAKRLARRAIGLVEAGFEDVKNAELLTGFGQRCGDGAAEFFILDHARSGDEKQAARRIEIFPNGGGIEHAPVLAVKESKVNPTRRSHAKTPRREENPALRLGVFA